MKRFICALMVCVLSLTILACGNQQNAPTATTAPVVSDTNYTVPSPMTTRNYAFQETPTTEQLRQTAVQAMRDLLSIQWCTDETIAYYKSGAVSKKRFEHKPNQTYGGTIYSNASTGLFQFMEYYDQETGKFSYPAPAYVLKEALGNSCADSLLWGWSSVCNSITGGFYPVMMCYSNGYIPVGDYTYNFEIESYIQQPSMQIVKLNGIEKIMECYTMVQPADALVSNTNNHAIMVVDAPHVVYNDDGSINQEKSYIPIQDQRGGDGNGFYDQPFNGSVIHYSGRTRFHFTFDKLLKDHYIPVTTAEFAGQKEYDKAQVSVDNENAASLDDLQKATIRSNYPLAVIRVTKIDTDGTETILDRKLFNAAADTGIPRSFTLGDWEFIKTFGENEANTPGSKLRFDVIVSTGETFTPITISL